MKKIIALLICLVLMSGCSTSTTDTPDTNNDSQNQNNEESNSSNENEVAADANFDNAVDGTTTSETKPAELGEWVLTTRYSTEDKRYNHVYARMLSFTTQTVDSKKLDDAIALHNSVSYDFAQIDLDEYNLPSDIEWVLCEYEVHLPADFPSPDYGLSTIDLSLMAVNPQGGGFDSADGTSTYIGLGTNFEDLSTQEDEEYMPGNTYKFYTMFTMIKGNENYVLEYYTGNEGIESDDLVGNSYKVFFAN